tara:strand:+ start:43 stop:423 length:381 start_codon:yes stop_codon:yes gene_type:complete
MHAEPTIPQQPPRARLNWRREIETVKLEYNGQTLHFTLGRSESGFVREVFCNLKSPGSEFNATVQDACVLISIMLQCGIPAEYLAKRVGRVEGFNSAGQPIKEQPASVLGMLLDEAARALGEGSNL